MGRVIASALPAHGELAVIYTRRRLQGATRGAGDLDDDDRPSLASGASWINLPYQSLG